MTSSIKDSKSSNKLTKHIEEWLSKIKEMYEKEGKIDEFNKEKDCLKQYLITLDRETEINGRLSTIKLIEPFRKGGTGIYCARIPKSDSTRRYSLRVRADASR